MSAPSRRPRRLARLDDRVVPVLQRGASHTASVLGAPFRALLRLEDRLAPGPVRVLLRFRQFLVLLAALVLFAGSYVHLQRYPELRAAQARGGGATAASQADGSPSPGVALTAVGPTVDSDVAAYVRDRRAALVAADEADERSAVVSFAGYLTAEEASGLLGDGVQVVQVQIRVPAAEQQPVAVAVDGPLVAAVRGAVELERERIAEEEANIGQLLESGTVEEEDFEEVYRADLERLAAAREVVDTGAGTVFAAVVRAPVVDLRALAEREGVRLVDLAPEGVDPNASTFYGLLPEDRERTTFGAPR